MNQISYRDSDWEQSLTAALGLAGVGMKVAAYSSISSTMDTARELLLEYGETMIAADTPPLVVVTREQVNGRGRDGRIWHSVPNRGLTITYLLIMRELEPCLPLAVGIAIMRACRELGAKVNLKWPNDVVWSDGERIRKIGGILCESTPCLPLVEGQDKLVAVLIGVGLNLNNEEFPIGIEGGSLKQITGYPIEIERGIVVVSSCLSQVLRTLSECGFVELLSEYKTAQILLGKNITIQSGSEMITGKVSDITADGGLVVHSGSKERIVFSGTVCSYCDI